MKIAPTALHEVAAVMTAQGPQEEEMMSINRMDVIHDQAMVIDLSTVTTVTATVRVPVLQKVGIIHLRSATRINCQQGPNQRMIRAFSLPTIQLHI